MGGNTSGTRGYVEIRFSVMNPLLTTYMKEAADAGDPFAQFELGIRLEDGHDGEQDFEKVSEWYAKAAVQGHGGAEANLLLAHVFGRVGMWSPDHVFRRLVELAESGDSDLENSVGLCYQFGFGVTQDYREAAKWFLRAANAGLAEAQFNLGGIYYEGMGLGKDIGVALGWYTKAAEQRFELALIHLGSMYQKGIGVEKDLRRALILYSIAYRRGSVRAANHLGILFKRGLGVERDDSIAYRLFLECVSSPDTPVIGENLSYRGTAYYWLGHMAEHGEGVKQDQRAAKNWYSKGAECGQTQCIEALARVRPKSRPRHSRGSVG